MEVADILIIHLLVKELDGGVGSMDFRQSSSIGGIGQNQTSRMTIELIVEVYITIST